MTLARMRSLAWREIWQVVKERLQWFLREVVAQFNELDLLRSAAALTYATLFAVVPFMTVGYVFLSATPAFAGVSDQISEFVFENFVPASSELIQDRLSQFSDQARQLTGAGVALLVLSALLMLINMETTFNRIWNVSEPRHGLQRFLVYWSVLTFGPPLIAASILISSYLVSLPLIAGIDAFGIRETLLSYLPAMLTVLGFSVLYYAMPNCRVPFKHAFYGGILAAIFLQAAQALYVTVIMRSNTQVIYGAFAVVPLSLIWLYMVWTLILTGAIFVRTLSLKPESETVETDPPLISCLRILQLLHRAHMEGSTLTEQDMNEHVVMSVAEREKVFGVLEDMHLLNRTESEALSLGRNLKTVTLWQLYQRLPEHISSAGLAEVSGLAALTEPLARFVGDGEARLSLPLDTLFDAANESQPVESTT